MRKLTVTVRPILDNPNWDFAVGVSCEGIATRWECYGSGGQSTIDAITAGLVREARAFLAAQASDT